MNGLGFWSYMPLFAMLLCAAATDVRARRIPNWLTFSMILAGVGQSLLPIRTVGPADAMLGFLTGFGLTVILFVLGAVGGGDVKLLAGIGAWIGPGPTLAVFAVEAILGAAIVLVQAVRQGRLSTLLRNSTVLAINLAHVGDVGMDHVSATGRSCRSVDRPLPFAVPTLAAVAMVVAFRSLQR